MFFLLGITAPVCAQEPNFPKILLSGNHDSPTRFVLPHHAEIVCNQTAQEVFEAAAKECGIEKPQLLHQGVAPETEPPLDFWSPQSPLDRGRRPGTLIDALSTPKPGNDVWKPNALLDQTRANPLLGRFAPPAKPELKIDYPSLLRLYRVALECPKGSRFQSTIDGLFAPPPKDRDLKVWDAEQAIPDEKPVLAVLRTYLEDLKKATPTAALRSAMLEELENLRSEILRDAKCQLLILPGAESQILTGLVEAFHKKLENKTIKKHADLYRYANVEEKALLDLLFSPVGGVGIDFIVGPERANYCRGILINGPIPSRPSRAYGSDFDPKSRNYLFASHYIGRGVPETVPALLKRIADSPASYGDPDFMAMRMAFGPSVDAAARRGYLQEVLMKIDRGMSGSTHDKIAAEKVRSYIHRYLTGLDRAAGNQSLGQYLPDETAALLSEGGKNQIEHVSPELLRSGIGTKFEIGVTGDELRTIWSLNGLPEDKKRLGMATMGVTSDQVRDIERRLAEASKNAQHALAQGHDSRTESYFYGRGLAEERKRFEPGAWHSSAMDRITNALARRGLGLSPEERLKLDRSLRLISQDLLADMMQYATEGGRKKGKGRIKYQAPLEELIKIVFSPEGKDDLIQAYAAMSQDPSAVQNFYRQPILDKLKLPPGTNLWRLPNFTPEQAVDLAQQAEDLLVAGKLTRDQQDGLVLFARMLRERGHEAETLYRDLQPSTGAHVLSSDKYVQDIVSRRRTRQNSQALGDIGRAVIATSDEMAKSVTATGHGFPLIAQSALEQFLQKTGEAGVQMLKQLRAGMKPEAFGKLMGGLDSSDVETQIFGALREHLPYSYYMMVNPEFQMGEVKQRALQDLLKSGKLSAEVESFLPILALEDETCVQLKKEEAMRQCLYRLLHSAAAEILMGQGRETDAEKLLAKAFTEPTAHADEISRIRERSKNRADTKSLGDALGLSLEQVLALGRGAMDQQTAAETLRQEQSSDWSQQVRANMERSLAGASIRDARIVDAEMQYRKLLGEAEPFEKKRRARYERLSDAQYAQLREFQTEEAALQEKLRPFLIPSRGGTPRYRPAGYPIQTQLSSVQAKIQRLVEQASLAPKDWEVLKNIHAEISALTRKLPAPQYGGRGARIYPPEHQQDGYRLMELERKRDAMTRGMKLPGKALEKAEQDLLRELDKKIAANRAHRLNLTNANRDGALAILSVVRDRLDPLRSPQDGEELSPDKRLTRLLSLLGTVRNEDSELRKRFHGADLTRLEDLLSEYEAYYASFGNSGQMRDAEGNPVDETKLRDFNARLKSAFFEHGDQMYGDKKIAETAAKLAPYLKGIEGAHTHTLTDLPQRVQGLLALCAKEPCGLSPAELEYLQSVQALHQAAASEGRDRLDRQSLHEMEEDEDRVTSDSFLELQTLREQLLANARRYDEGTNGYHTQTAFENLIEEKVPDFSNELKLKLLEQQKALNQDLLKGKSIADVIVRSARSSPPPVGAPPAQLEKWLEDSGFAPIVKNWKFALTSGNHDYKAPPKELDALFVKMLHEASGEASTRSARMREIEKALEGVVSPTGKHLAGAGLWDWDKAKLYLVADEGRKPSGKQKLNQDEFRALLNEYAELNSAEDHVLNPSLQISGRGEDELFDYIHAAFARTRYKRNATAVNEYSVVTPLQSLGEKPRYTFGNYESLRPEFERRTQELWSLMANNGSLRRAIAKKAEFGQAWASVQGNIGRYGQAPSELDNDALVNALANQVAAGISDLSQLGDAVLTVNGLETAAADEASRLRASYADVLRADQGSDQARLGNIKVIEEGTYLAIGVAATPLLAGGSIALAGKLAKVARMARFARTAARLEHLAQVGGALRAGQTVNEAWKMSKLLNMARGSYSMAKTMAAGSAFTTAATSGYKAYLNYDSADKADSLDVLGSDCKPGTNGIPDWRDALKCGESYKFPGHMAKEVDSDDNGIPDYYDYAEFGASFERYTMGSVKEQFDSLKNSMMMGAAIPVASAAVGKFLLRPLGNLIRGEAAVAQGMQAAAAAPGGVGAVRAAAPMYLQTCEGWVGTTGLKLLQGEALGSAFLGSAFMAPVDDWVVLGALKYNPKLGQAAIYAIKKGFNHGIDALQGASEVWWNGVYRTSNGVETKDSWKAALYSMGESWYMSAKASKPAQAQMDFVPKLVVDDLRRESRAGGKNLSSALLDYEMGVGKDRQGNPVKQRVRDIVTDTANMEDFNSPRDYEAFLAIFSEKLEAAGVPRDQIARAYTRSLQKTSKLELNFGEVSGLIDKMVREEKLRKIVSGEASAQSLIADANKIGWGYQAHQFLSAGDAIKETGKSLKKNDTRLLVAATAKDFGLSSNEFSDYIKARFKADPTVTSALTLRTLAQDLIREKRKKKR